MKDRVARKRSSPGKGDSGDGARGLLTGRTSRILLESTSAYCTGFTTGIQRVVRGIISTDGGMANDLGVQCIPVLLRGGQLYDARSAWSRHVQRQNRRGPGFLQACGRTLERVSPKAARCSATALRRLRKIAYPTTIARAISSRYWKLVGDKIGFSEDDVLLLLDESWSLPVWPVVREARQRRCCVGVVVYDLIPIDYPEFFEEKFAERFARWLDQIIDQADFFLAISETVAMRLRSYIASRQGGERASATTIGVFPLAASVPGDASVDHKHPRLRALFTPDRAQAPYLCVGTIEPRKNHRYLLESFENVWRSCPQAKLCLIGRVGWKCEEILHRIEGHPRFGETLFLFKDLSDAELRFCYRRAKALISSSVAEGFGLPIIEGLQEGLPVLASDIPIHREVGGSACGYFDLTRPESLARLILDREQHGCSPAATSQKITVTRDWRQSRRELIKKVLEARAARAVEQTVSQENAASRSGATRNNLIHELRM